MIKLSRNLSGCLVLLAITSVSLMAAPAATPAPAKPAPPAASVAKTESTNAPTATPPAPAAAAMPKTVTLDDYMADLKTTLNLSDAEKQEIESYYVADGVTMKTILDDDTLSPMQQTQQIADLRTARNAKINALLNDLDRKHAFIPVEAKYRVTLLDLAANSKMVAAPPPPAPAKS